MKKSHFLAVVFISMFTALYSSSWDGGAVRMMGLGNFSIALTDSTDVVDLYSAGFSSFLTGRDRKNIVSLSGVRDTMSNNFFGAPDLAGINFNDESSNYILLWLSSADALMINPQYLNVFMPASGPDGSYVQNGGGARVRYSHAFGSGFSAGAMVKFTGQYSVTNMTIGAPEPMTDHKVTARDFEFLIDAGLKMDNGFAFAASAGHARPLIYVKGRPDIINNMYDSSDFFGSIGNGYSKNGIATGPAGTAVFKYVPGGVNINAGAQYINPGVMEAAISGGAVLGFKSDYSQSYAGTLYDMPSERGTAYNASLKFRAYPASWLAAGFSAEGRGIDFSWSKYSPGVETKYSSDIAAGASYTGDSIRIPVEFFAHFQNGTWLYDRYGGVRGGAEWDALKWLTLRAGGGLPFIQEFVRDYKINYIYDITAGIGLNFGSFKADAGVEYSARSHHETTFVGWDYSVKMTSVGVNIKYEM